MLCGSLIGGHAKVVLAYRHRLPHGHQSFRTFSPDNKEAAEPVGPEGASLLVHCDHQTVPPCALGLATAFGGQMSVMEVSDFSIVLLLGNVEVAQAAYMGSSPIHRCV